MKESIEKRIALVREAETPEELRKHLCPFFEKGGHTDCVACRRTEADLEECREYYLSRIALIPKDIWDEEFDKFIVNKREKVSMEDITGIGINCDTCYMADKCPLFKRGYICGIEWGVNKPKTPMEFMDFLIDVQFERCKRAAVYEKIDGGVPDANLSNEMDRLSGYIATKDNMGRDKLSINVEASRASGEGGGGILAKLFGGGSSTPAVEAKTPRAIEATDVTYEETPKEREKVPVTVPRK